MTYSWRNAPTITPTGRRMMSDPDWPRPTGDTQPAIKVGPGELTCVSCGETFGNATPVTGEPTACWRCGGRVGVPTTNYLQEGEYTYAN